MLGLGTIADAANPFSAKLNKAHGVVDAPQLQPPAPPLTDLAVFDTLRQQPDIDVLAGGNAAALRMQDGAWEVLQFAQAELIGARRYRLSKLLRGQCGTEAAMRAASQRQDVAGGRTKAAAPGRLRGATSSYSTRR